MINKYFISVWDNGVGMDLEDYGDRVFGLFQQFHPHIQGKGLGLYLVKTQAESLGGTVSVSSEPGEFTEMKVSILKTSRSY